MHSFAFDLSYQTGDLIIRALKPFTLKLVGPINFGVILIFHHASFLDLDSLHERPKVVIFAI